MNRRCVKVLLFGASAKGSYHLLWFLAQLGCECRFATSTEEFVTLNDQHGFHLILSTSPLREIGPLLALLGGSDCTVFFCYPVENGCWWLPLVRHGQKCLGAPALRPSEFVDLLDQLVKEIDLNEAPAQNEPQEVHPSPHVHSRNRLYTQHFGRVVEDVYGTSEEPP